jgi:hypothetical protein
VHELNNLIPKQSVLKRRKYAKMDVKEQLTAQLGKLIDQIALSEKPANLNQDALKKIKLICKKYPDLLETVAWPRLRLALGKNDAKVRLLTLQIIHELFQKSQAFRRLVVDDLTSVLQLVLGLQMVGPQEDVALPGPAKWAKKLRLTGMVALRDWQKTFGTAFPHLGVALNWTVGKGGMELPTANATIESAMQYVQPVPVISANQQRTLQRYRRILRESQEAIVEMEKLLVETNNLLHLLIPSDPLFDNPASSVAPAAVQHVATTYALGSSRYRLEIDLSETMGETVETPENSVLFDQLSENATMLNAWIGKIGVTARKGWLAHITAIDLGQIWPEAAQQDILDRQRCMVKLTELKKDLIECLGRCEDVLHQDDFVAVDPEISIVPSKPEYGKPKEERPEHDPWNVQFGQRKHPESKMEELLASAPVVEYGEDLDHWDSVATENGKTNIPFNKTGLDYQHRFLGSTAEDHMLTETTMEVLGMRKRVRKVEMTIPHIRQCRAPLPSGELCSRRDMKKCPIHGPVIERDEYGIPMDLSRVDILAPTVVRKIAPPVSVGEKESKTTVIQRLSRKMAKNSRASKDAPDQEAAMRARDRQVDRW